MTWPTDLDALHGCAIEPLAPEDCEALAGWAGRAHGSDEGDRAFRWLLAYCRDGVVWGHRRPGGTWALSHVPFPGVSPQPTPETLDELRLFGPSAEVLVWRTEDGFAGRRLGDRDEPGMPAYCRPKDETWVLLGSRPVDEPRDGFTVVAEPGGSRQAVPFACVGAHFGGPGGGYRPLRLRLRHYLEQDRETGAVRVAATRLVDVRLEPRE